MANPGLAARTFVELADTLVDDYDVIDFVHVLTARCVDLFGVADAGVVLGDDHGGITVLGSSSERMRLIEVIEVQRADGPCLDVWRDGTSVRADRLEAEQERWPSFTPAALDAGFRSAYAVPLRLRDERIGALNLFGDDHAALPAEDQELAQALADVATIGILHERFLREHQALSVQLQTALTSRIILEQAKGVLAQQLQIGVDDAFLALRAHARRNNLRLSEVAADVVTRRLNIAPSSSAT
jgi:GAF domain/ANTAR domain